MSKSLPIWLDREEFERLPAVHREGFLAWMLETGYASRSPADHPGSWCGCIDVTVLLHWLREHIGTEYGLTIGPIESEWAVYEWQDGTGIIDLGEDSTPLYALWSAVKKVMRAEP